MTAGFADGFAAGLAAGFAVVAAGCSSKPSKSSNDDRSSSSTGVSSVISGSGSASGVAQSGVKDLSDVGSGIDKDFNIQKIFQRKIEEAVKLLDVPLKTDDPKLIEQLTLGDDWDDPFSLTKAMDRQPLYYARWATLLRKLKKERQRLSQIYDTWTSISKDEIADIMFQENVKSGMTPNVSKPTGAAIDNRFTAYCNDPKTDYFIKFHTYKQPLTEIEENIDTVEIVVKAFEQRKDMMVSLGSLVRSMIDNQLLIYKKKAQQSKAHDDQN